jgi:hypothetical protein
MRASKIVSQVIVVSFLFALVGVPTYAQALRFDSDAYVTDPTCEAGHTCPVVAVPGTNVRICTGVAATCAATATTFADTTAQTPCPPGEPLTSSRSAAAACQAVSDNRGHFGAWLLPGTYSYYFMLPTSAGGQTYGPYPFSLRADSEGYVYDTNYVTLASACTAAESGTLVISRNWDGLKTQTLSCNLMFAGGAKLQPARGQMLTISGGFNQVPFPVFDITAGGSVVNSNLSQPRVCYPAMIGGADLGAQINGCVAMLPGGGTIDSRTVAGALATTPILAAGIHLLLGNGVYASSNNPVIQMSSSTAIQGMSRTTTEIRYTGSTAGDILRCGSPTAANIACAYVTVQDVRWRPMEGTVASVGFHAYNPVFVSLLDIWSTHSECSRGLNDPAPNQGTCGTGRPIAGSDNVGAKFEVTSVSNNVPTAGQIRVSGWLDETGRGDDDDGGNSHGLWFAGYPKKNGQIYNISLEGGADSESTNIPIEMDNVVNASLGAGWFVAGNLDLKLVSAHYVVVTGVHLISSGPVPYSIDSDSYDNIIMGVSLLPAKCGTNQGVRTQILITAGCNTSWDLSTVPLLAGSLETQTGSGEPRSRIDDRGNLWSMGALYGALDSVTSPAKGYEFSGPSGGFTALRKISVPDGDGTMSLVQVYDHTGARSGVFHLVRDQVSLSRGTATVNFGEPAAFTRATSYQCVANSDNATAPVVPANISGSSVTFSLKGGSTEIVSYVCVGN